MNRIYSNGPLKDFVINPFNRLISTSSHLHLAAPYFTMADPVVEAAKQGKTVQLLVGINAATSPKALKKVHEIPNLAVRYFTRLFHAKIFIFDDSALLGSSNLTDGGLLSNREAVLCLDQADDFDAIEELRALFAELWNSAQVLTSEKLQAFAKAHEFVKKQAVDHDAKIEEAVGCAEPTNIRVDSEKKTPERIFLEGLRRQVYEEYRPAFSEVTKILEEHQYRRKELEGIGSANETNRFLNWVRLTYVIGVDAWQSAPHRPEESRRTKIVSLGAEWADTSSTKIPGSYLDWLATVNQVFGSAESIQAASQEKLTQGLLSLHAFSEQSRWVTADFSSLSEAFWSINDGDVARVKDSVTHLLYGSGDFVRRLHDVLYDSTFNVRRFGRFSALELYGTIKPDECPPMNGRMAKALRFLGFDVQGG